MHSKICTENFKLGQNRGRVVLVRSKVAGGRRPGKE